MTVLVFISAAIVFGGLYLAALQLGFIMGKRKYDPFKGKDPNEMTVQEIYDTMTDPQKQVCSYFVGEAIKSTTPELKPITDIAREVIDGKKEE